MQLKIEGSRVIVEVINAGLAPRHESQLAHWGFRYDASGRRFEIDTDCPGDLVYKVTQYLGKHKVSYGCALGVSDLLAARANAESSLAAVLAKGASLKDGRLDKLFAKDFLAFLRDDVTRRLKDHQVKAAMHLLLVKNGANFSVPGSGKTTVVVTVHRFFCRKLGESRIKDLRDPEQVIRQ